GLTAICVPVLQTWRASQQPKYGNRKSRRNHVRFVMCDYRLIVALTHQAHNEIEHCVNAANTWRECRDQNPFDRLAGQMGTFLCAGGRQRHTGTANRVHLMKSFVMLQKVMPTTSERELFIDKRLCWDQE